VTVCEDGELPEIPDDCAYMNEASTSISMELIPGAYQQPIICDGNECNIPASFDGDYIACDTTSELPLRITASLQSGVGTRTIEYLDQVTGNCEGNVVAKIENKTNYSVDNNSSILFGSDNITIVKVTNTIELTKITFFNLNYISAFKLDNASDLCGNSYWAGVTHEVNGWCETKGGMLPGSGVSVKAIHSKLDNGSFLASMSNETHPILLDEQGYPSTYICTGGLSPQKVGAFNDMGCPLPFQPQNKDELQAAVDLWFTDKHAAIILYGEIDNWNTSLITNMSSLFDGQETFNNDIGNWDVSNVTNMNSIFRGAKLFNQDIGNWDVSNVTNMSRMFFRTDSFNQDISQWNTIMVTDMSWMFSYNQGFQNGNVSLDWQNTSNVINMEWMFFASNFNQNIQSWDVSNVQKMNQMFYGSKLNKDISEWDVSSVQNMSRMFIQNINFNQDISTWNVSNVTVMSEMFSQNTAFNYNISSWNLSPNTDVSGIFGNQIPFSDNIKCEIYESWKNKSLSNWETSGLIGWGEVCL